MGSMRTGVMSDLVDCLEDLAAAHPSGNTPAVQAASMLRPGLATKTFLDFANQHFFTNIKNHTYNMLKE